MHTRIRIICAAVMFEVFQSFCAETGNCLFEIKMRRRYKHTNIQTHRGVVGRVAELLPTPCLKQSSGFKQFCHSQLISSRFLQITLLHLTESAAPRDHGCRGEQVPLPGQPQHLNIKRLFVVRICLPTCIYPPARSGGVEPLEATRCPSAPQCDYLSAGNNE